MEIKRVKVYQAVYLGKNLSSIFPNKKNPSANLDLLEGIGVKVQDGEHAIIVPYPNVAYIEILDTKKSQSSKSSGKAKA